MRKNMNTYNENANHMHVELCMCKYIFNHASEINSSHLWTHTFKTKQKKVRICTAVRVNICRGLGQESYPTVRPVLVQLYIYFYYIFLLSQS